MWTVFRLARDAPPTAWLKNSATTLILAHFATVAIDKTASQQPSTSGCVHAKVFQHSSFAASRCSSLVCTAINRRFWFCRQISITNSKQLNASSVGAYYSLDKALVPEAGRSYAGAFYSPREAGHERRGGCKALQQEVQATGVDSVMYRPVMHALFGSVAACRSPAIPTPNFTPDLTRQRLLLTGPTGAGKSIALAGLVEWARQQGWCVYRFLLLVVLLFVGLVMQA